MPLPADTFLDPTLLRTALTHRSYAAEHPGVGDNERLEFLGDSILGFVTADLLYRERPTWTPGQLSVTKHDIVRTRTFAAYARELGLHEALRLGVGARREGTADSDKVLEDTFEAIVGALYLDQGLDAVRRLVEPLIRRSLLAHDGAKKPPKSALQELCAARGTELPAYHPLPAEGPDHARVFRVRVQVGARVLGTGEGTSRRKAETMAALEALEVLAAE